MKGRPVYGLMLVSLSILLTGCHIKHEWVEATCTEPRTCSVGGETEGEALGHTWTEATCTAPKTCSVCNETEGEALGHEWIEATYDAPMTCSVCSETEGEPLPKPYAYENGIEFFQGTSFISTGTCYNPDTPENYEMIETEVNITDVVIEDAESEEEQTIKIFYTVKGRVVSGNTYIRLPDFTVWDIYTGEIIPFDSMTGDGQESSEIELEWDGKTYSIWREKEKQWESGDWTDGSDGNTICDVEMIAVESITVSKDYDGLALYMQPINEPWEGHFKTSGEDDGETDEKGELTYILDEWEDGGRFILVSDLYALFNK
ncbi:MAG: hypothetical protein NC548_25195 [Lachnospiraceae bacterium]|nr:hypothetical protein [Lachnospiraceae bacterium]